MHEKIIRSKRVVMIQTAVILVAMAALVSYIGVELFGGSMLLYAGAIGVFFLLFAPRTTSSALFSSGVATPLSPAEAPELYRMIEILSKQAGLPAVPQLGYMRSPIMNALSVGNKHDAAIIVTDALIGALSPRELAGVLAHEISHIRNNDLGILTFSNTLRSVTGFLSQTGLFLLMIGLPFVVFSGVVFPFALILALIGAPVVSLLLQLALSRNREFTADIGAVEITGDPDGLASALSRISGGRRSILEYMFGSARDERTLFRTHPSTDERIARLRELREADARNRVIRYT